MQGCRPRRRARSAPLARCCSTRTITRRTGPPGSCFSASARFCREASVWKSEYPLCASTAPDTRCTPKAIERPPPPRCRDFSCFGDPDCVIGRETLPIRQPVLVEEDCLFGIVAGARLVIVAPGPETRIGSNWGAYAPPLPSSRLRPHVDLLALGRASPTALPCPSGTECAMFAMSATGSMPTGDQTLCCKITRDVSFVLCESSTPHHAKQSSG